MSRLPKLFRELEINPEFTMPPSIPPTPKGNSVPLLYIRFSKNKTRQEIYDIIKSTAEGLGKGHDDFKDELHEILKFIEPYLTATSDVKSLPSAIINSYSLFSFILDLFILPDKVDDVKFITNEDLSYEIQQLLCKFIVPGTGSEQLNPTEIPAVKYCTLIVTENADLHSAADILATSWQNNTQPWLIRDVLVQENVQARFVDLVKDRLSKLDTRDVREDGALVSQLKVSNLAEFKKKNIQVINDKIAVGIPRNYVDDLHVPAPIVTLNIFRTTKEAASLYNKLNGGSASIWSENITETHELAKTLKANNIWINCNGVLDARCPFTFGKKVYGSEIFHYSPLSDEVKEKQKLTAVKPVEKAFYKDNFLFTVTSEPKNVAQTAGASENLVKLFNFNYKTVVVRFGQTFAN